MLFQLKKKVSHSKGVLHVSASSEKKILIMGGTRFIGVFLSRLLVKEGHQVNIFLFWVFPYFVCNVICVIVIMLTDSLDNQFFPSKLFWIDLVYFDRSLCLLEEKHPSRNNFPVNQIRIMLIFLPRLINCHTSLQVCLCLGRNGVSVLVVPL